LRSGHEGSPGAADLDHLPGPCAGAVQIIRRGKVFALHNPIKHCPRRCRRHGTTLTDPFGKARVAMHRYRMKAFAVIRPQVAVGRLAKAGRLLQYCVKYRGEVARRRIDDVQYLGHRDLLRFRFLALPHALVEPPLQLGVGPVKFGHLVIEHCGHVLAPSRLLAAP
jgi:hypothetical protein